MKGLEYVAVDPGIAKDPKIATMAALLKKDRFWVAGHFPAFFGEVATHAHDGRIGHIPDDLLDEWAGNVKGFGALVKKHMCDEGVLTAWWKYNGRAISRLVEDRERKAEYRKKVRGKSKDVPGTSGGNVREESEPNTGTGTGTSSPIGEELPSQGARDPAKLEERVRSLIAPFGEAAIGALDDAIARQRSRGGFIRQLWSMMNPEDGTAGPGGRPVPAEAVVIALMRAETSMQHGWHGGWFNREIAKALLGPTSTAATRKATQENGLSSDSIDDWVRGGK